MLESAESGIVTFLAIARVELTTMSAETTSMHLSGWAGATLKTPAITPAVRPSIPEIESENPATGSLKVA